MNSRVVYKFAVKKKKSQSIIFQYQKQEITSDPSPCPSPVLAHLLQENVTQPPMKPQSKSRLSHCYKSLNVLWMTSKQMSHCCGRYFLFVFLFILDVNLFFPPWCPITCWHLQTVVICWQKSHFRWHVWYACAIRPHCGSFVFFIETAIPVCVQESSQDPTFWKGHFVLLHRTFEMNSSHLHFRWDEYLISSHLISFHRVVNYLPGAGNEKKEIGKNI